VSAQGNGQLDDNLFINNTFSFLDELDINSDDIIDLEIPRPCPSVAVAPPNKSTLVDKEADMGKYITNYLYNE